MKLTAVMANLLSTRRPITHTKRTSSASGRRIRSTVAAGVSGLMVVLSLAGVPLAANAAGETLNVVVAQSDGTATFDGLDANDSNGIVRTNDTVSYTVSVQTLGGAQTAPTITFDLPQGQELVSLPSYCLAGSSVTPTTIGSLPAPVTATSWTTYPVQTVVCVLADRGVDPATNDYGFVAKVAAEVPNGTVMDDFTASVTSTAVSDGLTITSPESNAVNVEVAAAPRFDLSKNGTSDVDDDSGFVDQSTTTCTTQRIIDAGFVGCQTLRFPVLISVPQSGKGNSPLSTDITFVDDVSPAALWGAAAVANPAFDPDFAPAVVACGPVTGLDNGASFYPYGATSSGSSTNSVRDSGTFDCQQDPTGGPITVNISGADTSAKTYPTTNGTENVAMPAGKAYVISGYVTIEFPTAALSAIGVEAEPGENTGSFSLPFENVYTDLAASDLTGAPLPAEMNTDNNIVRGSSTIDLRNGFGKTFLGEPGNPANSGGPGYSSGTISGPPGSLNGGDGQGVVQAGGKVVSALSLQMDNPPGIGASTQVVCDAWDNTKIALTEAQWRGIQAGTSSAPAASPTVGWQQNIPSNGAAVWMSYWTAPGTPIVTYEYSNGTPGAASANSCRDETTGWYSSPAAVPGNDPTLAATGVYTGVSRVRAVVQVPSDINADFSFNALIQIGFTVLPTVATGDIIGNWGASYISYGNDSTPPTLAEVQADPLAWDYDSTYVPSNDTGTRGDRVTVQAVTARLLKSVWDPATDAFVTDGVPVYGTGVDVDYRLQPTLTSGTTTGETADIFLEDCLPAGQSFQSSTIEGGAAITPTTVTADGAPSGSQLACAAGSTYLRWDLGEQPINTPLPAIVYTVEVLATAPNGTQTNTALVTAAGDTSAVAARRDTAQIQIQTPTGIKLAKTTLTPVVDVNPEGIANPRSLAWTIQFAAIDTSSVSNVDIIDALPANGLHGSSFTGTLAFESASATASTGTPIVLYTKAAPAAIDLDPDAATNGASGATVWCDAPAGGSVVSGSGTTADCPAAADEVTGLRVQRAGAFSAGSTVTVEVSMIPSGNAAGDVYNNTTQADAQGVLQGVGPVSRAITIAASSIGDVVWNDLNGNGIQDAGEPGIAGFPVTVSGTDVDGNTITASTTTDAEGAYLFDALPSGTYTVTFDPAGLAGTHAFTGYQQGGDRAIDSDADQTTGVAPEVTLAQSEARTDIDAGVVQLFGGLIIVKDLSGAGAGVAVGPFNFSVVCTYEGASVYEGTVTLERVSEATTLTSERIGDIPVGASCLVEETGTGGADETPAPVTVLIVTNDSDNTVTAGFVNEFSAGTIALEKQLAGTGADEAAVKAKVFTITVTCQVLLDDESDPVTVFSQAVQISGGEIVEFVDANGDPILLPLGSVCFGEETDDGGADASIVDHDSFENGVRVAAGTPDDLQALTITAVNSFDATPPAVDPPTGPTSGLAITGADPTWLLILALLMLGGGGAFLLTRRSGRAGTQA